MKYKMGIDLGGTKTEVIVLDPDQQPVYRERVATPASSYAEILTMLVELVNGIQAKLELDMSIGVGIPGAISPGSGLLRNSNTVCMNGQPFLSDLQARLKREVRIENDANCFALSEALGGAARNCKIVFGVIIGTGTGGGLVIDGSGKTACIETFLSGPGFAHNYITRFDNSLSSEEIIAAAAAGDTSCATMLDLYHDQMARALAHVINILDPHAIVLGGGMSNIDSIYAEVPKLLRNYVFSDFVETPILQAERGDASGVYGAALLWP